MAPTPSTKRKPRTRKGTLHESLYPAVRRMYPTATRVVRHERLTTHGRHRRPVIDVTLAAFDAQGRTLMALRPEEMPELHDAVTAWHGPGYVSLDL
ncbi:hypothetical protein AMD26_009270 [Deinococcus sp. UR1]|nr:hypothetical protein AMD26_009270 [Deinococcus sp. UR1]